jgi:hypothetical protein
MRLAIFLLFSLFILTTYPARSQNKMTRREYIETYKEFAIREMQRSGIPASITIAQGCLESDNGNSLLAQKSNNHFGIKCKSDWKGPRVYQNDDEQNECFRKYRTVFESYVDHTDYLQQTPRYAYLFKLSNKDYNAWANGLKAAGYATDPNYPVRLIKIIEDEGLQRFDNIKPDDLPDQNIFAREGKTTNTEATRDKNQKSFKNITLNPYGNSEIKSKNGLDIIYVKVNDTFESIANELGMETWELHLYNDLEKDAPQPEANTFLYIERKRSRALKDNDFHTVRPNETMLGISQEYGITLRSLYFKNRMKKGTEAHAGSKLYLRKMKPRDKKNY